MPNFSEISLQRLNTCHEDLQVLFKEVIKHIDCSVIYGYRGKEEQEKAFNEGHTQLHYPNSKHNKTPSLAIDVLPYPIDQNNIPRITLFAGFVLGISNMLFFSGKMKYRIRWGGDWNRDCNPKNENLFDGAHFELITE